MAGLLDSIFNTPEGRLGLGLLAMSGPQSRPMGAGERIASAFQQQDEYKRQQQAEAMAKNQAAMQQAQFEMVKQKNAQEMAMQQAAMQQAQRKRDALPSLMMGGSPALSPLAGDQAAGILPSAGSPATVGALDVRKALMAGYTPDEIAKLDSLRNVGRDEVARTMKGMQGGREVEQQFDKFGRPIGAGMEQFKAKLMTDLGGQIQAIDPYTLKPVASFGKSMSPDAVASNAVAWANNAVARDNNSISRERLGIDRTKAQEGEKPIFDSTTGSFVFRPTSSNPAGYAVPVGNYAKPLNDAQAKAQLFGTRMQQADEILNSLGEKGKFFSTPGSSSNDGFGQAINMLNSNAGQQLNQAKRDFVNAVLRRESGAAISESEFANAERQYFPQIGDRDAVIKQKAENRSLATRGILSEVPKNAAPIPSKAIGGQFKIISVD